VSSHNIGFAPATTPPGAVPARSAVLPAVVDFRLPEKIARIDKEGSTALEVELNRFIQDLLTHLDRDWNDVGSPLRALSRDAATALESIEDNAAGLAAEIVARIAGDDNLLNLLNQEILDRGSGDASLQSQLNNKQDFHLILQRISDLNRQEGIDRTDTINRPDPTIVAGYPISSPPTQAEVEQLRDWVAGTVRYVDSAVARLHLLVDKMVNNWLLQEGGDGAASGTAVAFSGSAEIEIIARQPGSFGGSFGSSFH
jgi:hypothetical protein